MPVSAVRTAAAESTGLHYYDEAPAEREHPADRERELLIASIDELTPEDRAACGRAGRIAAEQGRWGQPGGRRDAERPSRGTGFVGRAQPARPERPSWSASSPYALRQHQAGGPQDLPDPRRAAAAHRPCRHAGCASRPAGHSRPGRWASWRAAPATRPAPGRGLRAGRAGRPARSFPAPYGRTQHVDGVAALTAGHHDPVIVCLDDAGPGRSALRA